MQNLLNTTTVADNGKAFDFGRKAGGAIDGAANYLRTLGKEGSLLVQQPMMAGYMASILFPNSKVSPKKLMEQALAILKTPNYKSKSAIRRTREQEDAYNSAKVFFSRAQQRAGNVAAPAKSQKPKSAKVKTSTDVVTGGNVVEKAATPGFANAQELEAYLLLQAVAMATTVRKNGSHASVAVKNAVAEFAKAMKSATVPH